MEFPSNMWPRNYQPFRELTQPSLGPVAAPVATPVAISGVLTGTYRYYATFVGVSGETTVSPTSAPVSQAGGQIQVALPTGPGPYTTARNIYRTPANGADGSELFLAQVADNTTTTYVDNLPDGSLGAAPPTVDTTLNAPLFEMQVSDSRLPGPPVQSGVQSSLLVQFGCKHILASNGTTLPERYHDVVLAGAAAYACLAVQVPTNDLFQYQDGELRDRVDESKTPEHWQAAGQRLLAIWKDRLKQVRDQVAADYASTPQWGAVPSRWQWT